jgi:CheY-like chemotaxis protein
VNRSVPRRLNLLLAEDNLPDALLVREAIRQQKLPVDLHIVADGPQALEFFARAARDPDAPCPQLLLLDLNLPMVDGFEVLRHLRASEKFKTMPVLVVTSSDAPSDRSQVAELGAGYFRKSPVYSDYLKIGQVLKEMLEKNCLL